ncbi:MAG: urate hydroxylase PuuD [Burkholderiaceae bacterium]
MEAFLLDWANLLLRWLHVIVAVAWIGASFYFVFLDLSLVPPKGENPDKVYGEIWAVHGGGFYHARKFMGAPPYVGGHLHWFYWESYFTWITGFLLLSVSYLWNPSSYLIDPSVAALTDGQAVGIVLGMLVGFFLVYELICRFAAKPGKGDGVVAVLVAVAVAVAAFVATELFSGRAAFLITGAMMATVMSANVLFWVIPGQKKMVAKLQAGEEVDPLPGIIGKQRSVHNTYFTLPVLFAMLSNHYGFITGHEDRLVLLLLIMVGGALIRHFFVQMHGYKLGRVGHPWPYLVSGLALLVAAIAVSVPAPKKPVASGAAAPITMSPSSVAPAASGGTLRIQQIVSQHCLQCHGAAVQMKNVRLDSPEALKSHALGVYQQVAVLRAMPMNNLTQMSDEERQTVAAWFKAGAPTDREF